jgi:hypothetical protein
MTDFIILGLVLTVPAVLAFALRRGGGCSCDCEQGRRPCKCKLGGGPGRKPTASASPPSLPVDGPAPADK